MSFITVDKCRASVPPDLDRVNFLINLIISNKEATSVDPYQMKYICANRSASTVVSHILDKTVYMAYSVKVLKKIHKEQYYFLTCDLDKWV